MTEQPPDPIRPDEQPVAIIGPEPERLAISPEAAAQAALLGAAVDRARDDMAVYMKGLCAGLGVDVNRVQGIDVERHVLLLAPEPN
jgi:hypothetical protein